MHIEKQKLLYIKKKTSTVTFTNNVGNYCKFYI